MISKPHLEFHPLDLDAGWETPTGSRRRSLAGELDEAAQSGNRTRLLRFGPGVFTTVPFCHDYWEEVYLVSGDLYVGSDEQGNGGERFEPNTYACRPPGVDHGPFRSDEGCLLLEVHYYENG